MVRYASLTHPTRLLNNSGLPQFIKIVIYLTSMGIAIIKI